MLNRYYLTCSLLFFLAVTNSGCVGVTTARTTGTTQSIVNSGHGLAISTSSLNFGNISVGSSSVLTVTLTNTGQSTITISNTSVSGPGFNATGISAGSHLNPGQSAVMRVTFAPAASGGVSGSVTISSNDVNSPAIITVLAVGVVPTAGQSTGGQSTGGQSTGGQSTGGQSTGGNTVTSITVVPADPVIAAGSQLQFRAMDNLGNDVTSSVVWASSNSSIATINAGGLATAIANGSVTITAAN